LFVSRKLGLDRENVMNTYSRAKLGILAVLVTLTACGGGGGSTNTGGGGGGLSATGFINWTWVSGSEFANQTGDYGIQGNAAITNAPRSLEGGVSWTDTNGDLWMFGGGTEVGQQDVNDLWKYDTGTNQWTWINGNGETTPNQTGNHVTLNVPNAVGAFGPAAGQYAATWVEPNGAGSNLWLFGGLVRINLAGNTGIANDLWKFDTNTNQWTWVSGSAATGQQGSYGGVPGIDFPGARWGAASWVDNTGVFWLFGGYGKDAVGNTGYLNDLWKYDTGTNEWTGVVSGSFSSVDEAGDYGNKAIASAMNVPGGRQGSSIWADSSGNLWLHGGYRFNNIDGPGDFNDLWKFNTVTNEWTWMSGSNVVNQTGIYGTPGTGSTANAPGARRFAVSWTDTTGKFWLFGGVRYNASFESEDFNDIWRFDAATTEWTWMSGSNIVNQVGVYGTQGSTTEPDNVPGARDVAVSWSTPTALWLFGGQGVETVLGTGSAEYYSDLWRFQP